MRGTRYLSSLLLPPVSSLAPIASSRTGKEETMEVRAKERKMLGARKSGGSERDEVFW